MTGVVELQLGRC